MRALRSAVSLFLVAACARTASPVSPAPEPAPADTTAIRTPAAAPGRAPPPHPPAPRAPAPTESVAPPARAPRSTVRLTFAGDINLGTTTVPDGIPPDTARGLFAGARPQLVGDLVVGNFEGVLADTGVSVKCASPAPDTLQHRGRRERRARRERPAAPPQPEPRRNCYAFQTPIRLAQQLVGAGFTHLNLANNHANDYGPSGRATTESTLHGLGLQIYGPIGDIAVDSIRRGDSLTVIGLVGFTTYPYAYDLLDIERSVAVVDSVRQAVDVLVVTFHGGTEGAAAVRIGEGPEFLGDEPRGDLRRWARAVINAGADAVVGHGPHVLRGIEFYGGKPIAYSLGNFATYAGFNLKGPLGVTGVLQLELLGDGTFAFGRVIPMIQVPRAGPEPDPKKKAIRMLQQLSSEDFGLDGARITDDGTIAPP